jgi:hypothetical protein
MVTGFLSPGAKRGRVVTLTTHPHLLPRSRTSRSYTSPPPKRLHGVYWDIFSFYLYKQMRPKFLRFTWGQALRLGVSEFRSCAWSMLDLACWSRSLHMVWILILQQQAPRLADWTWSRHALDINIWFVANSASLINHLPRCLSKLIEIK